MRLSTSLIAVVANLLIAGSASAGLTVVATQTNASGIYNPGDLVTVDIELSTTGAEAVALGLRAANYDPEILTNATVTVAPSVIFDFGPGSGFGGLTNTAVPGEEAPGGPRPGWSLNIFQAVSLTPAASAGPVSFQVTFVAGDQGDTQIDIGALSEYGDVYGGGNNIANNASLQITVIPEPGTALLMGLGLAGLATTRRKA